MLKPGKITKLTVQDNNAARISVFIEGAFAFGLYQDLVLTHGLHTGLALSVAEQEALLAADRELVAKAKALQYLAYRARTAEEVRRKLLRSDFDEATVEAVLARLHDLGYLDDEAYAHDYARARFRNRGYGPVRIRSELLRRGVGATLADAALEALAEEPGTDPVAAAQAQAERRWPRLAREPDPRKRRKKLSDFLVRRGFSYDVVRQVVEAVTREA